MSFGMQRSCFPSLIIVTSLRLGAASPPETMSTVYGLVEAPLLLHGEFIKVSETEDIKADGKVVLHLRVPPQL
jgi:hypothetical protein